MSWLSLQDASVLRFLVDMRGADVDDRQVTFSLCSFNYHLPYLCFSFYVSIWSPFFMKKLSGNSLGMTSWPCLSRDMKQLLLFLHGLFFCLPR